MVAQPAPGEIESANVVFEVAPIGADGRARDPIALGGSRTSWTHVLPAGRWRVFTTDSDNRHAEADVYLVPGDDRVLELRLQ
jgi:hypothetical protein